MALDDRAQVSIRTLDQKFTRREILAQDVRMIRATIHDTGKTRVSVGEIEALHEDVNRVQQGLAGLMSRVGLLEERQE